MFAAQKGLGIHAKMSPQVAEVKKFLVGLLDKLEADKKEIAVLLSQEDMKQKCALPRHPLPSRAAVVCGGHLSCVPLVSRIAGHLAAAWRALPRARSCST